MKKYLFAAALAALAGTASTRAAEVDVSVSIGAPNFYGHIDLGGIDVPSPPLLFPQPIIIQPVPVGVVVQPIYLRVPPGHAKDWGKHCHHYNACGRPAYFVHDDWYSNVYAPRYKEKHGGGQGKPESSGHPGNSGKSGKEHGKGKGGK